MYTIKATKSAKKLAKRVSAELGIPPQEILLECKSSADRQVQASDVERWHRQRKSWENRNATTSRRARAKADNRSASLLARQHAASTGEHHPPINRHGSTQAHEFSGDTQTLRIPQFGGQVLSHVTASEDHTAVHGWNEFMGADPEYTARQVNEATLESAPELAIYKKRGQWVTLDSLTAPTIVRHFRTYYPELAELAWGGER